MKKYLLLFLIFLIPTVVFARQGCCSHHGGVCGCSKYGRQVCCDGQLSPSCTCTPPQVYGCTDYRADNYNSEANVNDGSCTYTVLGCMDSNANNYNSSATKDDGSCKYDVYGCMDSKADNYNYSANKDDGSCIYTSRTESNDSYRSNSEQEDNDNSKSDGSGLFGGILGFFMLVTSVLIVKDKTKKK